MLQTALIVDDSVPIHSLIKAQLDRDGLQFHSAYCGESGISMAAEVWPDVILLDVDLPGIDGFEVCRRLKSDPLTSSTPIIFVTSDFAAKDKAKALDLGAAAYLTKPFKPVDLADRVDASLRCKWWLDAQSMIDGMTGLWNEAYLHANVTSEISLALPAGRPVACIVMDINGLNQINRRLGTHFGDRVIRAVGNLLVSQCRVRDVISHTGGGQFAILVAGETRAGADRLAERLCGQVREQLRYHDGKELDLHCSYGVADCAILGGLPLVERAAQALNRAKQNGGDRVSITRPPRQTPHWAS